MTDKVPAYYLLFDAEGVPTLSGFTPDGTLPDGAVVCMAEQSQDPHQWRFQDGQLVAAPVTQMDLAIYANQKQWALLLGGYTATVNDQACKFSCDGEAAGYMASTVMDLSLPNPPIDNIDWQTMDGSFVSVAPADFVALARRIRAFGQSTFTVLSGGLASIMGGVITTKDQVDALPWPANHD